MEVEKILFRFHEKVVSPLGWDGTTWVLDPQGNPVRGRPATCFPARCCRVCVLLLVALVAVFGGALASLHGVYVGKPGCLAPTLQGVLPYLPPRYDWYQGEAALQALQRRLLNLSADVTPPRPMTLDGYFGPYDVFRLRFATPEQALEGAGYVPAPTPGPASPFITGAGSPWAGVTPDAPSAWGGGRAAWIHPLPVVLVDSAGRSAAGDTPFAVPWWSPALTMGVGTLSANTSSGGSIGPNSTAAARAAFVPHLIVSRSGNGLQLDNRDRPKLGFWVWNVTVPAVCPGGAVTLPKAAKKSDDDDDSDSASGSASGYSKPWRALQQAGAGAAASVFAPAVPPAYKAPAAAGVPRSGGGGLARWALNAWVVSPETPLLNAAQWTWPFAGGAALDPSTGETWGWEPVAVSDTPAAARRLEAENEAAEDWSGAASGATYLEAYYPTLAAAAASGAWPWSSILGAGAWPSDASQGGSNATSGAGEAGEPFAPGFGGVAFSRAMDALLGLVAWFLASVTAAIMVRSMVTSGSVILLPMFGAATGEGEWMCPCCWGCGVCPRRARRLRRGLHPRQADCLEALADGVALWFRPFTLPLWAALQRRAPRVAAGLTWVWQRTPCGSPDPSRRRGVPRASAPVAGVGAAATGAAGAANAGAAAGGAGYISATATGGGGGGGFARLADDDEEDEFGGAADSDSDAGGGLARRQAAGAGGGQVGNPLRAGGLLPAGEAAEERVRQRRRQPDDAERAAAAAASGGGGGGDAIIAVSGGATAGSLGAGGAAGAPRQPLRQVLIDARTRLRERVGVPVAAGAVGAMFHPATAVRMAPPLWLEAAQAFPWAGREIAVLEQEAQLDYEATLLAQADAVEAELAAGEFGDIDPATWDPTPPPPPPPPQPPVGEGGDPGAPHNAPPRPAPEAPPPAPPRAHPFVDPFAETPEPPSFTGTLLTLVDARARVAVARRRLPRLRAAVWAHVWTAAAGFMAYQCSSLVLPALVWGGKSAPEGWASSAWSLLLMAEYFSVMFLRSRRGMTLYPHAVALTFISLHMYHTSTPYPLSTLALGVAHLLLLVFMLLTLLHAEAPALDAGEVSGDKPRALMCATIVPTAAPWEIPALHTMFLGINHTPASEEARPDTFLQGNGAAGAPPPPPPAPEAAVVVAVQ